MKLLTLIMTVLLVPSLTIAQQVELPRSTQAKVDIYEVRMKKIAEQAIAAAEKLRQAHLRELKSEGRAAQRREDDTGAEAILTRLKKLEAVESPAELLAEFIPAAATAAGSAANGLAGDWTILFTAGATRPVAIEKVPESENRYLVHSGGNLAGEYELRRNLLVIVKPRDPRMTGFAWRIDNANRMVLIGQPGAGNTGANYLGTTLTR